MPAVERPLWDRDHSIEPEHSGSYRVRVIEFHTQEVPRPARSARGRRYCHRRDLGLGLKGGKIGNVRLFLGGDRSSYDGGLCWEPWPFFAASDAIEVSRDVVSVIRSAGLIVGSEVPLKNLQNRVPCAQWIPGSSAQ
jgi:hypothetical protein